jgi:excisionase family DNA binding protein
MVTAVEGVAVVNAHAALSSCDHYWSPAAQADRSGHSDARLAKGTTMGKISIVSRRRRDKRFPETAAQRRARVRELSSTDIHPTFEGDGSETPIGEEDRLQYADGLLDEPVATAMPEVTLTLDGLVDYLTDLLPVQQETTVSLTLDPEQSQAISTLSLLANAQHQPLTVNLREWQDQQQHIVLQFSLYTNTVPEMLSFRDLCHQLKVGRRAVMRLIRTGQLRYYRIGKRYRFAAADVKQYLEQHSSQEL